MEFEILQSACNVFSPLAWKQVMWEFHMTSDLRCFETKLYWHLLLFPVTAESPDWQAVSSGPSSSEVECTACGKRGERSNRGQQANPDSPRQEGRGVWSVGYAGTDWLTPGWALHFICRSICAAPGRPCMGCCWPTGVWACVCMYLVGIDVLWVVHWHLWDHHPSKVGIGVRLYREPVRTH